MSVSPLHPAAQRLLQFDRFGVGRLPRGVDFGEELFGRAQAPAVCIHKAMAGGAAAHFVFEPEVGARFLAHKQRNLQAVVKARGALVLGGGGECRQAQVAGFDFEIGDADFVEHQNARGLEPDQVVAVVQLESSRDLVFEQPEGDAGWTELARLDLGSGAFSRINTSNAGRSGELFSVTQRMVLDVHVGGILLGTGSMVR
jgi:hypothetical protein